MSFQSDAQTKTYGSDSSEDSLGLLKKRTQDKRIYELERQLEIAENRCGTLREQVEYMRMLYHGVSKENESQEKLEPVFCKQLRAEGEENVPTTDTQKKKEKLNKRKKIQGPGNNATNTEEPQIVFSGSILNVTDYSMEDVASKKKLKSLKPEMNNDAYVKYKKKKEKKNHTRALAGDKILGAGAAKVVDQNSGVKKARKQENIPLQVFIRPKSASSHWDTEGKGDEQSTEALEERHLKRQSAIQECKTPLSPLGYQLPTISSEMKRARRYFSQHFDFRSIPFVAGRSITKSHNLGLKIQETLSMIKLRSPISVKRMEDGSSWAIQDHKLDFEELCHGFPLKSADTNVCQCPLDNEENDKENQAIPPKTSFNFSRGSSFRNISRGTNTEAGNINLKKVLVQLHEDFSSISEQYEKLQSAPGDGTGEQNVSTQLQELEKQLLVKETEINVIMELYKEILQLKQQVQSMSERCIYSAISSEPSRFNFVCQQSKLIKLRSQEYPSSLKLTRLMRRIQAFQEKLQNSEYR